MKYPQKESLRSRVDERPRFLPGFWGAVKVEYTAVPYKVANVAWTPEQLAELNFYKLLYNESDRGCVLVAAAYLEKQLAEVLQARMIDDTGVQEFFVGSRPLGTFSARIAIARYLGIISEKVQRDLDIIRKIRNDFAHNLEFENFENQSVKARCANLQVCIGPDHINQRDKFIDVATSLNLVLGGHLSNSQRPTVDPLELVNIEAIRSVEEET